MLLFDDGKKLEKVVGEEAAQIIVSMFERISEEQKKELATKGDLREESNAIRADVRETELRLQKEIKDVEYRLLKWQLGIGFAIILIMAKGFGCWVFDQASFPHLKVAPTARFCGTTRIATSYSPSAFIRMPAMPSPWASAQA